ncbi:MAG: hypothetical protein GWP91_00725 [Rhodobacterales bacterium]|nr:hypothetical protein [Rhodobacterales bacterium]
MIWFLLSLAAAAPEGIQVRVFPGAVSFAEQYAEAQDTAYLYDDLYDVNISCWDQVGIRDFNLDVPIDDVRLTLGEGTLTVDVDFGLIRGENMILYSRDADWLDTCAEFDTEVYYIELDQGRINAPLQLYTGGFGSVFGGTDLAFTWVDDPVMTGDISTSIAWVPDDLILYFVEDMVFAAANDAMTATVPPMIAEILGSAAYAGDYGGLSTSFELIDATLTPQAMSLYVDVDLSPAEVLPCDIGAPGTFGIAGGRSARLPLDQANDTDLGVGLTEALLNESMHAAWEAGWFCFPTDTMDDLTKALALFIDPRVAKLEAWVILDEAPVLVASSDGLEVSLPQIRIELNGVLDGDPVQIVTAVVDVVGTGVPGFDNALTAMTVSLVEPSFAFEKIEIQYVSGGSVVQPAIQKELEKWVAKEAGKAMQDVVLFDALYYAYDVAMLLERSEPVDGGLELYFSLFTTDDPAVDTIPPDTTISVVSASKHNATLESAGTDDRTDPLAYSWQVDGGGWSAYSLDTVFNVTGLDEGTHTIEVVARDKWLNVDGSPAVTQVKVEANAVSATGCLGGCSSTGMGALGGSWLLPLLWLRRRRFA